MSIVRRIMAGRSSPCPPRDCKVAIAGLRVRAVDHNHALGAGLVLSLPERPVQVELMLAAPTAAGVRDLTATVASHPKLVMDPVVIPCARAGDLTELHVRTVAVGGAAAHRSFLLVEIGIGPDRKSTRLN